MRSNAMPIIRKDLAMTNVYRTLAAAHGPAHLPAPHGPPFAGSAKTVALVTLAAIVLCAALYLLGGIRAQCALHEQTLADARVALVAGLSRADCYAWLRAHDLVATNISFAVWHKTALGGWYRAGDGAWPQPALTRPHSSTRMSTSSSRSVWAPRAA
jgi:hypothetical protein